MTFYKSLLLVMLLFTSELVLSQVGPVGARRQGNNAPLQTPSNYQPEVNVNSMVNEQLPGYIEALNLDAFETEIFKTILIDHYKDKEDTRQNYELKFNDKQDIFLKQEEKLYQDLATILNEEEIQTFKSVKFLDQKELKKKKKKDKKRRKKKNKNKDKEKEGTQ